MKSRPFLRTVLLSLALSLLGIVAVILLLGDFSDLKELSRVSVPVLLLTVAMLFVTFVIGGLRLFMLMRLAGERTGAALQQLARTAAGRFLPHTLIVHESAGALPVFEGRSAGVAPAVAWVCHDRSCLLPVTEPAQLAAQLPGGPTDGR